MIIPEELEIGGLTYHVKRVPENSKELDDHWGMHVYKEQIIYLSNELKNDVLNQVFLHEVMHAVCDAVLMRQCQDESYIEGMSQVLLQVIKQLEVIT